MGKHSPLIISFLLLAGCTTLKSSPSIDLKNQARIWINQTAALEVYEAYSNEDQLYIKFKSILKDSNQFKDFYGRIVWDVERKTQFDLSKNLTVNLDIVPEEKWNERPPDLNSITSLPVDHWVKFRVKLIHSITPEEENMGVVLRSDQDELILYYDGEGYIQFTDVEKKPTEIKIKESLSQDQLTEKVVSAFEKYLQSLNIDDRHILLTVGGEYDYVNPFVYIDLDERIVLNLKLDIGDEQKYRQNLLRTGIKTADYLLLDSHVLGIIRRPFSSPYRLFSWSRQATLDAIKPPKLNLFERSPIPSKRTFTLTPSFDLRFRMCAILTA